ncbi:MAG: glycosyltransferase [Bacteroidetes bacterium]|nr:glycosyltransferase [Bacteroidota bacterium]MCL2302568.1 glycosyltransferase [Lentimicrobiaceae bacterium]
MYILHLPSWFSNEKMPFCGNFIEKHIAAISMSQKCVTLKVVRGAKAQKRESTNAETQYTEYHISENNILVEYFINDETSFLGKVRMKIREWYYYRKGMKFIEKQYGKPKLIHLHVALPMGKLAVKWSKKWNIPLVLTEHWSIYNPLNRTLITPAQKRKFENIYAALSGITTVSNNLLNNIQELFSIKKSAIIYNVVDTGLFVPQKNDNSPKKILHISTLDESAKNFMGILESIKLLSEKRQDFVLEVIHEFRNLEAEAYVKEHHLEKFVHFLGSMSEKQVAAKMGASDFFLLFSNYENLPCVLLEAMSCGKPVITTPVGGISEIVNAERGIFVEPKNVNQLVEKLDFMLQHFETFNGEFARNYAVTHFSKDVICRQFKEFYEVILHSSNKS